MFFFFRDQISLLTYIVIHYIRSYLLIQSLIRHLSNYVHTYTYSFDPPVNSPHGICKIILVLFADIYCVYKCMLFLLVLKNRFSFMTLFESHVVETIWISTSSLQKPKMTVYFSFHLAFFGSGSTIAYVFMYFVFLVCGYIICPQTFRSDVATS